MLNNPERTATAPPRARVAQSAIAPKEATARITRLVGHLGVGRQYLVVAHDVAIATLALPIAFMLRESSIILPAARADYVLSALPLAALAALVSTILFGSYRAVWRYLGVPEIVRLAQFAAIAVLLFQVGHFLVDRLDGMPRSVPPLQFLVMMFAMLTSRIAYGELLRWIEAAPITRQALPILLIGSGDGTALFIRMLGMRRQPEFEPVGSLGTDHGIATTAFLTGGAVAGGRVITDWPGLRPSDLYEGRDLAPTTDLRSVIKGIALEMFDVSPGALDEKVFPESREAKPLLGLIA